MDVAVRIAAAWKQAVRIAGEAQSRSSCFRSNNHLEKIAVLTIRGADPSAHADRGIGGIGHLDNQHGSKLGQFVGIAIHLPDGARGT